MAPVRDEFGVPTLGIAVRRGGYTSTQSAELLCEPLGGLVYLHITWHDVEEAVLVSATVEDEF